MESKDIKYNRLVSLLISLIVILITQGCAHTLPLRTSNVKPPHGIVVGIKSFCDANGFDYAEEVKSTMESDSRFSSVRLTPDLNDPICDYVIRGNFCYYRVSTYTTFFYASTYAFYIPILSGLPTSYIDGSITANVEIYHKGNLLKTFSYEDVFRSARSIITLFPTGVSLGSELHRVARCIKVDLLDIAQPEKL